MRTQSSPVQGKKHSEKSFFEKHEYILIFSIIFLIVTVSNLSAVFGLDILFQDDNARYYSYINDEYQISNTRSFIGFALFLKWIIVVIFSNYSTELARLYVVLVYMIPASCLFYFFNRRYLHVSVWASLTSAVIINSIPRQFYIPTFLDGSYPAVGMLFFISTLIISAEYLKSSRNNYLLLILASFGWVLVCDLMNEMGIFLLPVFLYFVYSSKSDNKKKLTLFLTTSVITSFKLFAFLQTMGVNPVNKPTSLSIRDMASRIIHSIEWWMPTGGGIATTSIVAILIIAISGYSFLKLRNASPAGNSTARAFIFYGLWYLASSFPFWFLSKFYGPRYLYISYFALTAIASIGIYYVFIYRKPYKNIIAAISLLLLFTVYTVNRNASNTAYFNIMNKKNDVILSLLSDKQINTDTQIALVNFNNGTGGFHIWSSGYLRYILKKPRVTGIIGNEENFYDPFNMNHCGYGYRMSCLETGKELIAFKKYSKNQTAQMNYFLQWKTKGDRNSEWSLYQTDENNKLSMIKEGRGLDSYLEALSESNLKAEHVLWGNSNDEKSLVSFSQ
ncbi:hypothetical protein N9112_02525 [bacterium]|nr:hypothetical protein [bacterium]